MIFRLSQNKSSNRGQPMNNQGSSNTNVYENEAFYQKYYGIY